MFKKGNGDVLGMRHVLYIGIMVGFTAVVSFVVVSLELAVFDYVPPQIDPGTTLGEWKSSFQHWAWIVTGVAGGTSVLWYILAQWVFIINRFQKAGKRHIWALLSFLPTVGIVVGVVLLAPAENGLGLYLAYLFLVLNALACYYLLTLLFSPSSFKFSPLGSSRIRRWH